MSAKTLEKQSVQKLKLNHRSCLEVKEAVLNETTTLKSLDQTSFPMELATVAATSSKEAFELTTPNWADSDAFGGTPILFGQIDTPDITADFLPPWLKDYADAIANQTNTPVGLAVMLSLSILATCLQKKFVVSAYDDNSYIEPLNICTLAALSTTGKNAVLTALTKPITEREKEEAGKVASELAYSQVIHDFHTTTSRLLIRKAAKTEVEALTDVKTWGSVNSISSKHNEAKDLVLRAALVKDKAPTPLKSLKQIIISDLTQKSLPVELAQNQGKVAIITNDSNLLKVISSPVFLNGRSGGTLKVKIDNKYVFVDETAITVGMVVPLPALEVLKHNFKRHSYSKELLAAFLHYLPRSNVGNHHISKTAPIPKLTKLAYSYGIDFLLDLIPTVTYDKINDRYLPQIISLTDEARGSWLVFSEWLADEGSKFESLSGWVENLPGMALRIAGLVHIAMLVQQNIALHALSTLSPLSPFSFQHWSDNSKISNEILLPVLQLCIKLIAHAKAAYDLVDDDKIVADTQYVLDWLLTHVEHHDNGAFFISQHALHIDSRFRKSKVTRVIKALDKLASSHTLSSPCTLPTRKPTKVRFINPALFESETIKNKLALINQNAELLPYLNDRERYLSVLEKVELSLFG